MKTIQVGIKGIAPLLFNRFTEEAQIKLEKGTTGKKGSKKQRVEEAKTKTYRNEKGEIGVPAINIKKCILQGCQMATLKIGRRGAEPYMRAAMFLDKEFVSLDCKEPDGIHECTGRIPPGPRGKMAVIRRPFVREDWRLNFRLMIFDDRVDQDLVAVALAEAGKIVGLGDHRPEYGRFDVTKFEIEKEKADEQAK